MLILLHICDIFYLLLIFHFLFIYLKSLGFKTIISRIYILKYYFYVICLQYLHGRDDFIEIFENS